jgi:thioredoxin 1
MSVVDITSKEQFDALLKSSPYVALQAHASWCGPCKAISPFFAKHATQHSVPDSYTFARFDTDDVPDLAFDLGIRSIPAFFFFENGDKSQTVQGANPAALKKTIDDLAAKATGGAAAAAPAEPAAEKPAEPAVAPEEAKKDPVVRDEPSHFLPHFLFLHKRKPAFPFCARPNA